MFYDDPNRKKPAAAKRRVSAKQPDNGDLDVQVKHRKIFDTRQEYLVVNGTYYVGCTMKQHVKYCEISDKVKQEVLAGTLSLEREAGAARVRQLREDTPEA